MATKNPRVVGYISPETHEQLQQFMREHGCTESKAIALILEAHFRSGTQISTPVSKARETLGNTPDSTPVYDEILERIRNLETSLEASGNTPSNTPDKLAETVAKLGEKVEHLETALAGK